MLLSFPYHGNYVDLVRMELNALASVSPGFSLRTFAILGSGPLPLTSLCICHHLEKIHPGCIRCHNVDQSAAAISCSTDMCRALGHSSDTMCFQCADANSPDVDLSSFDVVYLAALVGGCSKHKHSILADMVKKMKPGSLVVMRSVHSMRRLLYPVCVFVGPKAILRVRYCADILIGCGGDRGDGGDWAEGSLGGASIQSCHQLGGHCCCGGSL